MRDLLLIKNIISLTILWLHIVSHQVVHGLTSPTRSWCYYSWTWNGRRVTETTSHAKWRLKTTKNRNKARRVSHRLRLTTP